MPRCAMFLVAVLLLHLLGVVTCCYYPDKWQGHKWYVEYIIKANQLLTVTYNENTEHYVYTVNHNVRYSKTYRCKDRRGTRDYLRTPYVYHMTQKEGGDSDDTPVCTWKLTDESWNQTVVEGLLFDNSVTSTETPWDLDVCLKKQRRLELQPPFVEILVQMPLNLTTSCPFRQGRYHLMVELQVEVGLATTYCVIDQNSNLFIEDGQMRVHSCLQGSSYTEPFKDIILTCYKEFDSLFIRSQRSRGLLLMLAVNVHEIPSFYIARYRYLDDGKVRMSLQGSHSGRVRARADQYDRTVGDWGTEFSYVFIFKFKSAIIDNPTTTRTTTTTSTTTITTTTRRPTTTRRTTSTTTSTTTRPAPTTSGIITDSSSDTTAGVTTSSKVGETSSAVDSTSSGLGTTPSIRSTTSRSPGTTSRNPGTTSRSTGTTTTAPSLPPGSGAQAQEGAEEGVSGGVIGASVAGVLLFLFLIAAAMFLLRRSGKCKDAPEKLALAELEEPEEKFDSILQAA